MLSKLARRLVLASVLLAVPLGCGAEDKPAEVEVLPAASNGSPIAVKFVEFTEGDDGQRNMNIKLYNSGDKTAVLYFFVFRYYDANDELLKIKPGTPFESDHGFTSMFGRRDKCEPKQNNTLEISSTFASVPPEAVRAEILATKVRALASDGVTIEDWWVQENWGDWPAG